MIKKLSVLALAGCFAMPTLASAASNADLASKIDQLTQELAQLRDQMEEHEETFEEIDEKAEGWDLASRIQITGDIRSRLDLHQSETADHYGAGTIWNSGYTMLNGMTQGYTTAQLGGMGFVGGSDGVAIAGSDGTPTVFDNSSNQLTAANWNTIMGMMNAPGQTAATRKAMIDGLSGGSGVTDSEDWENDTFFTTRLRMNMRVKATENIEVKARVVGYKSWGMQSNPNADFTSPYYQNAMAYDGTVGRMPADSSLLLDRAFMNWNNIGGAPVWFSIGRRPTTDGPPAHLRMGSDKRMATPVAFMDYPFDGISMGYAYANLFGMSDIPGRVRFCYGRGFEDGVQAEDTGINDTDFAGLSWDVMKKGNQFINVQSFVAMNIFNVPGDITISNPMMGDMTGTTTLDRQNMGDIYHTSAVYMDKISDFHYFATLGWSMTDGSGDADAWGQELGGDANNNQHGYSVYLGGRYDLEDLGMSFGAEYNWGSENWLAFTPGHDDMYASKLGVRGNVYELYMIYDLPSGEAISKYGKAFMRLGYQHYDYEYSGSGNWMAAPVDMDELTDDPLSMQSNAPLESYDTIYLTLEAYF